MKTIKYGTIAAAMMSLATTSWAGETKESCGTAQKSASGLVAEAVEVGNGLKLPPLAAFAKEAKEQTRTIGESAKRCGCPAVEPMIAKMQDGLGRILATKTVDLAYEGFWSFLDVTQHASEELSTCVGREEQ